MLHLAALIAIPYSYHSPDTYVDTNIKGTLNVVQAARELGVSRVVHTSTSEVYGTARFVPITEEHPLQGQSPYSASKIGADQLAMSFYASFGTPVTILRPFNTYGPRQSARAVIPTIITQIASGARRIKLGALHPTRDFNYVSDTVAGFLATLRTDRGVGEVINLGSNFEISIGDVARNIADIMQAEIEIVRRSAAAAPGDSEVSGCGPPTARPASCWAGSRATAGSRVPPRARGDRRLVHVHRRISRITGRTYTTCERHGRPHPVCARRFSRPCARSCRTRTGRAARAALRRQRVAYLKECLDSSYVSSVGQFVDRFEAQLAAYTGAKHAIAV